MGNAEGIGLSREDLLKVFRSRLEIHSEANLELLRRGEISPKPEEALEVSLRGWIQAVQMALLDVIDANNRAIAQDLTERGLLNFRKS